MAKDDEKLSYDEQIKREFEMSQGINEEHQPVKDLGKVDLKRGTHAEGVDDDPNIQRILNMTGYYDVPLTDLPSKGRYYPTNTRISIRAARVGEIREFSSIDENNIKDVTDKLTYIVSQCSKVMYGNVPGQYRDLIAADRIVLVLKIRELTFTEGLHAIKIPVPQGACQTIGCVPQTEIEFESTKLDFEEPDQELEKYYDVIDRCYKIQTKSFGEIQLYIPTIGVATAVQDWAVDRQRNKMPIDASLAEILQYVIKDWRGLDKKRIEDTMAKMAGWSTEKFILVTRLIEKIKVGIKFEIRERCQSCGGEIKVPISFPDGYRSLFVPTIHDLGGELL